MTFKACFHCGCQSIFDKKIGDEVDRADLGILADYFTGKIRMLKITYTIQDENGATMDSSLKHKDFIEEEDEDSEKEEDVD